MEQPRFAARTASLTQCSPHSRKFGQHLNSIHQSCVERSERLSQGDLTKSIHHILVHFKGCVENKGMTVPIQDETEQVRLHAVSLSCASKKE